MTKELIDAVLSGKDPQSVLERAIDEGFKKGQKISAAQKKALLARFGGKKAKQFGGGKKE
jgi:hypothetical protein